MASPEFKPTLFIPNLYIFLFLPPGHGQCEASTVLLSHFLASHACSISSLTPHPPRHWRKSLMNPAETVFNTYPSLSSLACETRQGSLRAQWTCICVLPLSLTYLRISVTDWLFLGMVAKCHLLPFAYCVDLRLPDTFLWGRLGGVRRPNYEPCLCY